MRFLREIKWLCVFFPQRHVLLTTHGWWAGCYHVYHRNSLFKTELMVYYYCIVANSLLMLYR